MEVIRVENVSKLYDLGQVGTGTISKDLNRWWARVRGQEDPYARVGQTNDRTQQASKDESVWALRDVSFTVKQGDVLGIIGRNGAGKSTLLKVLSRITTPTGGTVKVRGRMASLLEVGTGFHPEMTGRENVFMNGTLLGMTRREVKSKLDEIIDFAGVAKYIDTPVKRYSSGMQVRLAFAVAAFLEPEILIVDEVLAVGDADFQRKALGRMKELSRENARTVLFVSHNLLAVRSLCRSGVLMNNGKIETQGKIEDVIHAYLTTSKSRSESFVNIEKENDGFQVNWVQVSSRGIDGYFNIQDELVFTIKVASSRDHESININIFLKTEDDAVIFATQSSKEVFKSGEYTYQCIIPAGTLNDIVYKVDIMVVENGPKILHTLNDVLIMEGMEERRDGAWMGKFPGLIRPTYYQWNKSRVNE
jgi:lipopolysaccharide transport system ATP-binding protein